MSAEPAYSYYRDGAAERAPERVPSQSPRISVVPGSRGQQKTLSEGALIAARVAVAAIIFLAALSLVRVAISAATIETTVASDELSDQIEEARSEGTELEVSASIQSSPSRLRQEASALGMTAATTTETITLDADVVVCDDDGNLSLSLSVAQAAGLSE